MELFKQGDIKAECAESCPTFLQCRQIALAALTMKLQANSILKPTGIDFVDETTGEYISEAEYFGGEGLTPEAAETLYRGAEHLSSAAESYRDLLAECGCVGPKKVSDDITLCTGLADIKEAIRETYEDINNLTN